jgi:nucleotide-binding universal stress UspA family protein
MEEGEKEEKIMIIVGVDGSAAARVAVDWAADDALRVHEPLRIVHAVDRLPYQIVKFPGPMSDDMLMRRARMVLDEAEHQVRSRQPYVEVSTEAIEGTPAMVLQDQAREAAELVIGSRGLGGFAGALLGSVSMHVAGQARCPVVVVRPEQEIVPGEVVVGIDDLPECQPALAYAVKQAQLRGATLRVIYAWQLPVHVYPPGIMYDLDDIVSFQRETIAARLSVYRERFPELHVIEDVPRAHPVDALTEVSAKAALVVVGSHGRGSMRSALLGSVSHGVLHHARCAVAVVRE